MKNTPTLHMGLFKAKHQKLILQCYPPGRDLQKPNALELLYLLYYALTRRIKLEKVAVYLERKALSDVAHPKRFGAVLVTLEICGALVDKCGDNLSVFGPHVAAVLRAAVGTGDLGVVGAAVAVYGKLARAVAGDMLAGDQAFVESLFALTLAAVRLGNGREHDPQAAAWRQLAVELCLHLAHSLLSAESYSGSLVDAAVGVLKAELPGGVLPSAASVTTSPERRLSKASTRTELVPPLAATSALQAFFDSSSSTRVSHGTRALCHEPGMWFAALLQQAIGWTPVQLRFVAFDLVLGELRDAPTPAARSALADAVALLLALPVLMVGLAVPDVLRQVATFQAAAVARGELPQPYTAIVTGLTAHRYYHNQTADMVQALLAQLGVHFNKNPRSSAVLSALVADIRAVCGPAQHRRASMAEPEACPLGIWSDSLCVLSGTDDVLATEYLVAMERVMSAHPPPADETFEVAPNLLLRLLDAVAQFGTVREHSAQTWYLVINVLRPVALRQRAAALLNGLGLVELWQKASVTSSLVAVWFVHAAASLLGLAALDHTAARLIDVRQQAGQWVELDREGVAHVPGEQYAGEVISREEIVAALGANAVSVPEVAVNGTTHPAEVSDVQSTRLVNLLGWSNGAAAAHVGELRKALSRASFLPPGNATGAQLNLSLRTHELVLLLDELEVEVDVKGWRG